MKALTRRFIKKVRISSRFLLRWLSRVIQVLAQFLLAAWATLAIYFSNLPWLWTRLLLAIAFLVFTAWALWVTRRPRMRWVFVGAFVMVLIWFLSIRPSHDRPWKREVAIMPRAIIVGDRVRLTGFRNFDYRTRNDFTIRYEEREVSISHLSSVDVYISYWTPGVVAHTFVSFCFDNAPPVCISIEVRPQAGQGYAPLASAFKQFGLIYVVGDERDLVRVRTNYRSEQVYLYPIRAYPEAERRLFRIYLDRINQLADHPEFYNLISNSCTINIVRYAKSAGYSAPFDYRHLLNGLIDQYLYSVGAIDTSLPFDDMRQHAHINDAAQAADQADDFSQRIRAGIKPGG